MNTQTHSTEHDLTQPQLRKTWLRTTDNADFTNEKQVVSPIRAIRVIRGLFLGAVLLGALVTARADTLTVTTLDDSGPGSLRQSIADSAPGDTIDFAVTGTITLTSGQLMVDKDLTISGPGATNLTVRSGILSRIFYISGGIVHLSGLRVSDANPVAAGGGILVLGQASVTVDDCVVSSNVGYMGGGGIHNQGILAVTDSTISSNSGNSAVGAGIYNSGTLIVSNSTISGNITGGSGGGIYNTGSAFVYHSVISTNRGDYQGAGILNSGTLWIMDTFISGNRTYNTGGGILSSMYLTLINTAVCGNRAGETGYGPGVAGGIYHNGGQVSLINCTVSGNWAMDQAGGVKVTGEATLSCTNCTITANYASERGGGLFPSSGCFVILQNTVLAGNWAAGAPDCDGTITSCDFNLIGNTNGATITGVTTHNIYGQDPLLGPLADNGGPTPTHALLPGSPAIDHGSSGGLATDQRGKLRPCNFAAIPDADDGSDIGAYELQGRSVTTLGDSGPCSLRQAIADAAPGDTMDFAVTGTITLTNGQLVIDKDLTIAGPGVTNLTVSGNNASRVFEIKNATVALSGLRIADGFSSGGGGILSESSSTLALSNCKVTNCRSTGSAGGIFSGWPNCSLKLINTTVQGNTAAFFAGGVYAEGTFSALNSTFSSNSSAAGGGGLWVYTGGGLTNCTISGNSDDTRAGGILCYPGPTVLNSCTVVSNSAGEGPGGIEVLPEVAVTVRNTIIANNTATGGFGADASGVLNSLDYNLVGDTNGATFTNLTAHNIYGQDPLVGALAENSGPTMTHALLPGSPAIDQGSSGDQATDQRGQARPIDFPDIANAGGGDGSDMGAYEVRDLPQAGPVITVNSTDDVDDGVPGVLHCSLREAIAHAAPGDTIDFAVTGTITLTSGALVIDKNLSIVGPGAPGLVISGNNASPVFVVDGGWYCLGRAASISDLTITKAYGSGVVIGCGGSVALSGCTLAGNDAGGGLGGAVWITQGLLNATNCTFSSNTSQAPYTEQAGGAIYIWAHNPTPGMGGAVLKSCTVCSNTAMGWGGGIAVDGGYLVIEDTIIAGNTAGGGGPDCDNTSRPWWGSSISSADYNLIGNTKGAVITGITTHNIYGEDPKFGPLADNGGPTPTHALLPGSPAIDHGSSGGLATDQRGLPRPFNFPAYYDADDAADIGAVEMQEGSQPGPVFTVNTTDDVDDGVAGMAHCSLREAINAANVAPGFNSIVFATNVPGLYSGVTGTILLTNGGELDVRADLSINGPGASLLTVSGNNWTRVLHAYYPSSLSVSGLTIADGHTSSGMAQPDGSGIYCATLFLTDCVVTNCDSAHGRGGGIYSYIHLSLLRSTISGNKTTGRGGGICSDGQLYASDCTFFSNLGDSGGGIYNSWYGTQLTNCTISANGASVGGGIASAGSLAIRCCTIFSNTATTSGGGVAGEANIGSSIVAGNNSSSGPDISGQVGSADYNLIQDTNGCTITNLIAHNIYNQDPKLGPLADLGGPTPTHALRYDSPALDAGHSGGLTTDQRGFPRPIGTPIVEGGDASDIGAYEADPNLRIMAIEKLGEDIRLRFNSLFGRSYKVERTDSLTPPVVWTPVLGAEVVAGNGGTVTIIDPAGAAAPQRFYRIQMDTGSGTGGSRSALSFDGGDRVIVTNKPALNPSTITVETWVNFGRLAYGDGYSPTDHQFLIVKGGDTSFGEYRLTQSGKNATEHSISFFIGPTYTGTGVGVTWPLQTDRWYHLAGTYDGSLMQLFIDGQVAASNYVGTVVIGNSAPLFLGYNDAWPFYLTGQMDDVRIWNYARTEAQIRAAMYSTLTGNEPGLAGYWDLNEAADSQTVRDRSPNGCHGQLGSSMAVDADDPTRVLRGPVR